MRGFASPRPEGTKRFIYVMSLDVHYKFSKALKKSLKTWNASKCVNSFPVYPVSVDRSEGLHRPRAVLAHLPADEDPVRAEQVADGAPLGQELRVGQHLIPRLPDGKI